MSKPLLALCVLVLLRVASPAGAEAEEESWEIALVAVDTALAGKVAYIGAQVK